MTNWLKYGLPIMIIVVAVLLYYFIPTINEWVLRVSKGWKGALLLGVAGVALARYYALLLGFRGRTLAYAIGVIVFTGLCIWLLANWGWFTDFLEVHLGTWGMIGVLLLLCLFVWLGIMCL